MSSSGALGPSAAKASRAAASNFSTLRWASARRGRGAVTEAGRLSVGVVFTWGLLNGDSLRIVLAVTGEPLRLGPSYHFRQTPLEGVRPPHVPRVPPSPAHARIPRRSVARPCRPVRRD